VPQIGSEGLGTSEILESSEGPHEGVLGQILGQVPIPGEEVSESNDVCRMLVIEDGRSSST
jgi:hypothetical protein